MLLAAEHTALTWWEGVRLIEEGGWRKGADLRVTAPEDDSSETHLGSYSGVCRIQNNTITRNHGLNSYWRDWKTSWWKTIRPRQNKGLGRAVAHGLLIEGKKDGCVEGKEEIAKRGKEADPTEWSRLMGTAKDTHNHTNKETWRYIKLKAIISKPVA